MRRTGSGCDGDGVLKFFVVERNLVGWSGAERDDLGLRCTECATEFAGRKVRHVESIVIPGDETCLSVFEGPDAQTVRDANEACGLPTGRVLPAIYQPAGSPAVGCAGPDEPAGPRSVAAAP